MDWPGGVDPGSGSGNGLAAVSAPPRQGLEASSLDVAARLLVVSKRRWERVGERLRLRDLLFGVCWRRRERFRRLRFFVGAPERISLPSRIIRA